MTVPKPLNYREPKWAQHHLQLPPELRDWLLDDGSLTQRLKNLSQQQFAVSKLRQQWQKPRPSECRALGLKAGQRALIREVLLLGQGQAWVYARSVLPIATLSGSLRSLKQLDEKPLGALLFSTPNMQRGPIETSHMKVEQLPLEAQLGFPASSSVWGRRSVFRLHNKPLLVSETFLPNFPAAKAYSGYPA